ncbi:oligosaccharide flippase family protein [Photobacterium frigidiphilum]|uniref:oligosaccharide flippase family protein n=1 Tax=Photobacterium frigidiphilum TaxID=264736 RepID=UPI003D0E7AE1
MITKQLTLNSIWLIFDKCFILLGGLITTLIVARYLKPEDMGLINYAVLIAGFCSVVSQWGAKFTIFESSARKSKKTGNYVSKTIIPRVMLYLFVWMLFSIYIYITENREDTLFVSVLSLSMIFLALDIYQYFFDGSLLSKYNTFATFAGRLFSIFSRLSLVYFEFSLWYFLIPLALEGVIILLIKFLVFNIKLEIGKSQDTDTNKDVIEYFKNGTPIVIFSFFSLFYDKLNMILIKEYLSFSDVAIFTMAKTLSMAWTFLPLSFATSIITKELSLLNGVYLSKAYRMIFFTSVPAILVTYFYSGLIINITLGDGYYEAKDYLFWLCVLAMFSCVNITTNRVIASKNVNGKSFLIKKSFILSILSVFFGVILIGKYGIDGALINASIIMFVDLIVLNVLHDAKYFKDVLRACVKTSL